MHQKKWVSRTKKTLRYKERNHEKRISFLQSLRKTVKEKGSANIVYMDESGFEQETYRAHAWSKRGKKSHGERFGRRFKRTNLIAAKRQSAILAPILYESNTTAEWVNQWFEHHLFKELEPESTIILDNAKFHRKTDLCSLAQNAGHQILFLPPYSPDLNPIEQDFAIIKKIRSFSDNSAIDYIMKSYGLFLK